MKKTLFTIGLVALLASGAALASGDHGGHKADGTAAPAATTVAASTAAEGEVRKIDKEQGKITLKHGEIKNLDMPGMTMVFRVKDAAMLDQVQAGDKVGFTAAKIGGQYTVTGVSKKDSSGY